MTFTPLGGGREIGANSYLLSLNGKKILIDAGRHPVKEGYDSLPELDTIDDIDVIIISHSHYDHISSLPYISTIWPKAPVLMAQENKGLALRILQNSVEVMKKKNEKDSEQPVLYNHGEVNELKHRIYPMEYFQRYTIDDTIEVALYPAGHVMGAASIYLEYNGRRILYSGDFSLSQQLTIPPAQPPLKVETLISEGTYGSKENQLITRFSEIERLSKSVKRILENKGRVLLPVFALGRGQETIYMLMGLMERGKIPTVPIYTNGMVASISNLYMSNYERISDKDRKWFMQNFQKMVTVAPKNIERLLFSSEPAVFVFSAGMLVEETLSYIFAREMLQSERDGIFFMGYQSPESDGYRVLQAHKDGEKQIALGEETIDMKCKNIDIFNFSGHADYQELLEFPRRLEPEKLIYVHGDAAALENLAEELQYEFQIEIPANLQTVEL
jgi:Cft2 family RNA processing exonuclease